MGIGLAGQAVSWAFVAILPLPYIARVAVDGMSVVPVWAAVGPFKVGLVVALLQPDDPEARRRSRRPEWPGP